MGFLSIYWPNAYWCGPSYRAENRCLSFAGAICGWGVIGYYAYQQGWAPLENPMKIHDPGSGLWGARGWILWPGVAIMVADALMSLALSWKTFVAAFKGTASALENKDHHVADPNEIPNSWWMTGLALDHYNYCFLVPFWYISIF